MHINAHSGRSFALYGVHTPVSAWPQHLFDWMDDLKSSITDLLRSHQSFSDGKQH